jgi:glycosyltransferase involved in cell wall biosynthesis
MIRVAIDTNALFTTRAGVARYIQGLQSGLAELNIPDVELSELAWKIENLQYKQPWRALKTLYRELIWAPLVAPRIINQRKIDILHSAAGPFISVKTPVRSVVTLHDLAVLRFPHRFRRWHRISALARLKMLCRADRIICVSQFTADEAIVLLALPPKKLEVIHNGADELKSDHAEAEQRSVKLPAEFLLFVGSLEPGKNLGLLKKMYFLAESSGKSLPPLVIIGARWSGVPGEGPPPKNWVYLGEQSDAVLRIAYQRARALLFPSIYEGFGFPIVEAQLAGCPVICSAVASLPEIAGAGALFVDATPEGYLSGTSHLEAEPDLRDNLIREGKMNAARFSWGKCATQTAHVYEGVLK